MKKRFYIFNVLMAIMVLFTILFKSVHSYEHFQKQRNEKHCVHKANNNKSNITHRHASIDYCFECQYTISSFKPNDFFLVAFKKDFFITKKEPLYKNEILLTYRGKHFSQRGPPFV